MTDEKLIELCNKAASVMHLGDACSNAAFCASKNDRHASKIFQDAISKTISLSIHNVLLELEKEK